MIIIYTTFHSAAQMMIYYDHLRCAVKCQYDVKIAQPQLVSRAVYTARETSCG